MWCRGLWCVRDALCACCVLSVSGFYLCVSLCVCLCWCVWCVVLLWCGTLKTSVCAFNTSPCVRSTHGDVLNAHTEGGGEKKGEAGHRHFCSPKLSHVGISCRSIMHYTSYLRTKDCTNNGYVTNMLEHITMINIDTGVHMISHNTQT